MNDLVPEVNFPSFTPLTFQIFLAQNQANQIPDGKSAKN